MFGIAHIAVTTRDMEKSLDFYTNALGLKKVFEIPEPETGKPWIIYLYVGGRQFVELFYNGSKDNPWQQELCGFNHLCLEVDNIHTATEKITKAGYTLDSPPKQGADYNWQAWVKDPDGIRVELMQIDPQSPQAKVIKENS
jgi:catechol 2,3-dioxygenase-like lactoylglutathione lyase family enzyme